MNINQTVAGAATSFENIQGEYVLLKKGFVRVVRQHEKWVDKSNLIEIAPKDFVWDFERIQKAIDWVEFYLMKSSSINERESSYTLKHHFEQSPRGCYISNGEFIIAMDLLGYMIQKNGPNALFNFRQVWGFVKRGL